VIPLHYLLFSPFLVWLVAGHFSVPEAASLRSSPAFLSAVKFLRVIK
jgi:hypothetical protein